MKNNKARNIDRILDNMTPATLAKLTVVIGNVMERGMDSDEMIALNQLSALTMDAGFRNCGEDFTELYLDAYITSQGAA